MARVVAATGPLEAGGWGSALGALGGFGGQGFLVPATSCPASCPRRNASPSQETRSCCCPAACARSPPPGTSSGSCPTWRRCSSRPSGTRWASRPPQSRWGASLRRACLGGSRPSSASGGSGRRILPPAASLPLSAGGRGPCPRGARSSRACRLRTWDGCGGSAGPAPTHAEGAPHGDGAAATSCPPPANLPLFPSMDWSWGWLLRQLL